MKISAVIPVYNENLKELNSVLDELKNFVDEIIVVDDGSELISNFQFPISNNLYLLRHEINRGQGAALQTGTDFAIQNGAEIIVHFDGDGQHQAADIPKLVKPIQENQTDFVFGSKVLGHAKNIPWMKKKIILPIAKIVNYIFTGLRLTDVHNGLRAFHKRVSNKLYLTQDRMAHNTEYAYLVKKNNIKYIEVPVKIIYNKYGQGVWGGFKILKELISSKLLNLFSN